MESKMFYNPVEIEKLTGISKQKIRVLMADGTWDLGGVIKSRGKGVKDDYIITPYKLFKQLGIILPGFTPPAEHSDELVRAIKENTEMLKQILMMK